jgi:hypothetical protein
VKFLENPEKDWIINKAETEQLLLICNLFLENNTK